MPHPPFPTVPRETFPCSCRCQGKTGSNKRRDSTPFLKEGTPPLRAGAAWGALYGNALLPAPQTPTFITPPRALPRRRGRARFAETPLLPAPQTPTFITSSALPRRRGVGRLSKARNIRNVSVRNTGRGRCFCRNGAPPPAFRRFSSFCPCPTCGLPIQRTPALRAIWKTRRSGANTAADCFCRLLRGNVAVAHERFERTAVALPLLFKRTRSAQQHQEPVQTSLQLKPVCAKIAVTLLFL